MTANTSTFLTETGPNNNYSFLDPGSASAGAAASDSVPFVGGLTAHAGGGQGSATLLALGYNRFTTVATASDSAILPANAVAGDVVYVSNTNATKTMNVFPPVGGTIAGLGVNAALTALNNKVTMFVAASALTWDVFVSA